MAEALINHLAGERYRAVSAGSAPTGAIHPASLSALARRGLQCDSARRKSWDEFESSRFELVITVCNSAAAEPCPFFLGESERLHWDTPDPALATGSAEDISEVFDGVLASLERRIKAELL